MTLHATFAPLSVKPTLPILSDLPVKNIVSLAHHSLRSPRPLRLKYPRLAGVLLPLCLIAFALRAYKITIKL
ncbi:hypothetical protein [Cerasicoccus maritimus]|uniref:hypothetical protein n=1 Tax=Cerasicoccus maritimus TaxID=490089 RepID=UPI0028525140|nr:hypothetical protein [Cerasicoccus maritimus]